MYSGKWGNENRRINVIDTPGDLNFLTPIELCLRASDLAVVVVDGKVGFKDQSTKIVKLAQELKIPTFFCGFKA